MQSTCQNLKVELEQKTTEKRAIQVELEASEAGLSCKELCRCREMESVLAMIFFHMDG
jgi:hypothetical protein